MNAAGLALIKHYEGFSPTAYLDMVGVPTIGYGFTRGVKLGDTITQEAADARLLEELVEYESGLRCVGTPNQLAAMTSLAFNIGVPHFSTSTVKRLHLLHDYGGAAKAFLMWDKAGNQVVPGLVKRRAAEADLYLTTEDA